MEVERTSAPARLSKLAAALPSRCRVPVAPFALILAASAIWIVPGCSRPSSEANVQAVEAATQARARLVWCEDAGDGTDTLGDRNKFRLRALDTRDGRGARNLLWFAGPYTRPMIVPSGDRVVFTDRKRLGVYVVNWDGSNCRQITNGYAVAVWKEPKSGIDWVYVQGGTNEWGDVFDRNPIWRCQIDHPEINEVVWNKTPVSARASGNFQVSADGSKAAGLFPWPLAGVAELPNRTLHRFGSGCWTSMAGDGTDLFWKFDGAHRNLLLYDLYSSRCDKIPVSIESRESYHPRWSNLSRFFVESGPYKEHFAGGAILGGGAGVEIYLGRFDPEFKKVEKWVQITQNRRADFYPDLWIEPSSVYQVRASNIVSRAVMASGGSSNSTIWPPSTNGLVFLWEDRTKPNEVWDPASGTMRRCIVEPQGLAIYSRSDGMELRKGAAFLAPETGNLLLKRCQATREFSLVLCTGGMESETATLVPVARFGPPDGPGNFVLGQEKNHLVFLLQTAAGSNPAQLDLGEIGYGSQIIITFANGRLTAYLEGARAGSMECPGKDLTGWAVQPLVFGGEARVKSGWTGQIEGVAIYDRALSEEEARENALSYVERFASRTPSKLAKVTGILRQTSVTPSPASIAPYRRCLVVDQYEVSRVWAGVCSDKTIQVARWGILDGEKLPEPKRKIGEEYALNIEPFEDNPQLESERMANDLTQLDLPMYYDPFPVP